MVRCIFHMDLNGGKSVVLIIWDRGDSCVSEQYLILLVVFSGVSETSVGMYMLNHSEKMILFYLRFKKDLKLFLNSTFWLYQGNILSLVLISFKHPSGTDNSSFSEGFRGNGNQLEFKNCLHLYLCVIFYSWQAIMFSSLG